MNRTVCPPDEQLAAFYAGSLDLAEEDALRDHLASCAACVARAKDARRFVDAIAARPASKRAAVWWPAAAAIVGGLLVAWFLLKPPSTAPMVASATPASWRWNELLVEPPPYVPTGADDEIVWRSGEKSTPVEGTMTWAMVPYTSGDYAGAIERLNRVGLSHPGDDRIRFFHGVSLLLAGRPVDAESSLIVLARSPGPLAREASFYAALARLKTGDEAGALELLTPLAADETELGTRARALLAKIQEPAAR